MLLAPAYFVKIPIERRPGKFKKENKASANHSTSFLFWIFPVFSREEFWQKKLRQATCRYNSGWRQSATTHLIIYCFTAPPFFFCFFKTFLVFHYRCPRRPKRIAALDCVKQGIFFGNFWVFFDNYSTPRQCHRQSQIFTAPCKFSGCRSWYHFDCVRFLEKRSLLTFWDVFWGAKSTLPKS